jgi:predicted  nucleic acid-binding Zn-ribbon protein
VGLFRPLEKPVEKLLKLSEREKQRLNPTAAANLSDYVTDPVEKLSRSNINYSELESALNGLQSMLERNVIDLKDSRVRAALKSISLIKDQERLEELRERYLEATSVYQKASQSEEVRSLLLKRDEMDSKRNAAEEMVGRLDRALSAIQARKEELSKRFVQLKEGMEKSIKEVTGQSIQISNL